VVCMCRQERVRESEARPRGERATSESRERYESCFCAQCGLAACVVG